MVSNSYPGRSSSPTILSDSSFSKRSFDMRNPNHRESKCVVIEYSQPPKVKAFVT